MGCISCRLPSLLLCLSFVTISPVSSVGPEADHLQGLPSQSTTLPWVLCGTLQYTQIAPFWWTISGSPSSWFPRPVLRNHVYLGFPLGTLICVSQVGNCLSSPCPSLQYFQFSPQTCSILLPGSSTPILLPFQGAWGPLPAHPHPHSFVSNGDTSDRRWPHQLRLS